MAHVPGQSPAASSVILLGDHDTARHRDELTELAAQHGCAIANVFFFAQGAAASNDDLTEVDAVVAALARAIADRIHVWVPFPGPDFGREQHWRRLSLVLQRHGLNVRFGRELAPCPATGGYSEVDIALRREVQTVDDLDNAALAAAGVESLGREIELALVAAGAGEPVMAAVRRVPGGAGTETAPRTESAWPPVLPAPTVPWAQRQPMLKRYVRWLVHDCGVTQVATARVLNSAGQRTPKGRRWRPATVSALLNGRYDHGGADARA
ncbi:MAG TPA: hypothetical protein VFA16_21045 [Mycobacterium sp.]|uniref:hypothetical protein n=1 Tax=Mycobacterium sp. TaxID=1785 RepID=UPI002D5C7D6A|nr:hypothetical protein [Mycobacterium sp.]HZU49715.1 hypothetical protein [Mycobacterium sp.]